MGPSGPTKREMIKAAGALVVGGMLPPPAHAGPSEPGASRSDLGSWSDPGLPGVTHRFVQVNGIKLHVAEQGRGPLVLLCHGFPECWYSWRHQLRALADAGFRAVAPDLRGYGRSDCPAETSEYTILHHIGDLVELAGVLDERPAAIVGHDFGATIAWQAALMRPDRFNAVAALSAPFRQQGFGSIAAPTTLMPRNDNAVFYQLFLQTPEAEVGLSRNPRKTFRSQFYTLSGDRPASAGGGFVDGMVPRRGAPLADPLSLPSWITERDIDVYVDELLRSGFRGPLAWYRNLDLSWELLAPMASATLAQPALYIAGERDFVAAANARFVASQASLVPKLRPALVLPGCGHWTQQERAPEVSAAIVDFLRTR